MVNNSSQSASAPRIKIKDMVFIAMSAVFIIICAQINIPTLVPFTLQTFGIALVLGVFGGKRGSLAVLIYILLGAIGIPVFSGFKGGLGALLGTTGGYILGFLLMGLVYLVGDKIVRDGMPTGVQMAIRGAALVVGLAVCYAFGTAWFMVVYSRANGAVSLATALAWCVTPFIIPDLIKLAAAVGLAPILKKTAKID